MIQVGVCLLNPSGGFQQLSDPLWRLLKRGAISTNSPKSMLSVKNHEEISTAVQCKPSNWDAHGCSYEHTS